MNVCVCVCIYIYIYMGRIRLRVRHWEAIHSVSEGTCNFCEFDALKTAMNLHRILQEVSKADVNDSEINLGIHVY